MRDRSVIAGGVVLAFLVLFTYRQAPDNGFRFDDGNNIVENETVHMEALSLQGLGAAARGAHARRPLAGISFAIDWWRGGGQARAFLRTNVTIHTVNALLLFWLLLLILPPLNSGPTWRTALAGAIAAVWALHPIQVQAVSYIVQRMASLATFFVLFALIAYLHGRRADGRARWGWWVAAAASGVLGSLTKEIAWVLPILIILLEYGVARRGEPLVQQWWDRLIIGAPVLVLLYLVLDITSGAGPVAERLDSMYAAKKYTLAQRLLTQPRVVSMYLSQWLWPAPSRFAVVHDDDLSTGLLTPWTTLPALLGVLAWCAAAAAATRRTSTRPLSAFLFWPPVTLALESSVVPLIMVFEHRMYLPSVGLTCLLGLGAARLTRLRYGPPSVAAVLAAIILALMLVTPRVIAVWSDDVTLWEASSRHASKTYQVWNNLGKAHAEKQDYHRAIDAFMMGLSIQPRDRLAFNNLGRALHSLGMRDIDPRKALLPWHGSDWLTVARGLAGVDRHADALTAYTRATGMLPDSSEAWTGRGWVQLKLENITAAEADFDRALELDRTDEKAWEGRAMARYTAKHYREALEDCAELERLAPQSPTLHLIRGASLHFLQRDDEAAVSLERACELGQAKACQLRKSLGE